MGELSGSWRKDTVLNENLKSDGLKKIIKQKAAMAPTHKRVFTLRSAAWKYRIVFLCGLIPIYFALLKETREKWRTGPMPI